MKRMCQLEIETNSIVLSYRKSLGSLSDKHVVSDKKTREKGKELEIYLSNLFILFKLLIQRNIVILGGTSAGWNQFNNIINKSVRMRCAASFLCLLFCL